MRIIHKSDRLSNVKYEVRGPVLEEANRMIARGEKVIKLNIGNPAVFGFNAPDELFDDLAAHARSSQAYSDSKGVAPTLEAIAAYCRKKGIPDVGMDDIYTGNGSSELITLSLQALLDTGDEILVPAPDYPLWTAAVTFAGGKAVHYMCDEQAGWNPDTDDIRKKVTPRTKAIVVINPNNPTGAEYGDDVLKDIVQVAREHGLMIFSDEIYDRLVMGGKPATSIASLAPDVFCITFNGLSKSHTVCGFRCGWMCLSGDKKGASDYIDGLNVLASMRLCSNVLAQNLIPGMLNDDSVNPEIMPGGRLYEQCEYVHKAMNDIPGVSAVKPRAALYIFPKLDERFGIKDDQRFALDLLHEQHVLVVQGTGFSWAEPNHFRIVFLPELDVLADAVGRIGKFLETYRQ